MMPKTVREMLIEQGLIKPLSAEEAAIENAKKKIDPYTPPAQADGLSAQLYWLAYMHPVMVETANPTLLHNWREVVRSASGSLGSPTSQYPRSYRKASSALGKKLYGGDCLKDPNFPKELHEFIALRKKLRAEIDKTESAHEKRTKSKKKYRRGPRVRNGWGKSSSVMRVGKIGFSRWGGK